MSVFEQIKAHITPADVAREHGIDLIPEGSEHKIKCPFHDGGEERTGSCTLYDDHYHCYACDAHGDAIDLYAKLHRMEAKEAIEALARRFGIDTTPTSPPAGTPGGERPAVAEVRRLLPKNIRRCDIYVYPEGFELKIHRTNGKKRASLGRVVEGELVFGLAEGEYFRGNDGCWRKVKKDTPAKLPRKSFDGVKLGLYRPELWESAEEVLLVEGPKDAETAISLGLFATTTSNGCRHMRAEHADALAPRRVVVIPDHDKAGLAGAEKRAKMLHAAGCEVRLLEPLGGKPDSGYDLTDWARQWRTDGHPDPDIAAALRRRIAQAPPWRPSKDSKDEDDGVDVGRRCTDIANAERYGDLVAGKAIWIEPFRSWVVWTGSCYERDEKRQMSATAREVPGLIEAEAADHRGKAQSQLERWAKASSSSGRQTAMVELAKADRRLIARPGDFDRSAWTLNCRNGLLNLQTGRLTRHELGSYPHCMKVTSVDYDPQAQAPRWQKFLDEIFIDPETGQPDSELIAFVQRAVGYSLTGDVSEKVLFMLHDLEHEGYNGKSVFLRTLATVLGFPNPALRVEGDEDQAPTASYAYTLPISALLDRGAGMQANNPDVANLDGVRLALAAEAGNNARWNESLIKLLTGGDPITACRKYENPITFMPSFKVWVATNYRPSYFDPSAAFERRMRCIPFAATFKLPGETLKGPREKRADSQLDPKLLKESEGILAWAVEGCAMWMKQGLGTCAAVERQNETYREEQNPLSEWLRDRCVVEAEAVTPGKELYASYSEFCGDEIEPYSKIKFSKLLQKFGYPAQKQFNKRCYRGLRLRMFMDERAEEAFLV